MNLLLLNLLCRPLFYATRQWFLGTKTRFLGCILGVMQQVFLRNNFQFFIFTAPRSDKIMGSRVLLNKKMAALERQHRKL
jgi:hypothetical protein